MIQNVLSKVGGIEVFGILSILLFFACFTGVILWVLWLKKPYLERMKRLPLEDEPAPNKEDTAPPDASLTKPQSR